MKTSNILHTKPTAPSGEASGSAIDSPNYPSSATSTHSSYIQYYSGSSYKLDKIIWSNTKLFPYVDVNQGSISAALLSPPFAGKDPQPVGLGFTLIRQKLVPNALLEKVDRQLDYTRLNCHQVTNIRDLFEADFLESLTKTELDLLGDVVLIMIELGLMPITLDETEEAE